MLAGGKPHSEISLWMNACDLFVLPSLRESFGIVQIEAMACGKPVVATRNGGSEELIKNGVNGLLVEPGNAYDMAEKIKISLEKDWNNNEIVSYANNFKWDKVCQKILNIYTELMT